MRTATIRVVLAAGALALAPPAGGVARAQETAPVRATVSPDTAYGCVVCHSDKRQAFVQGIHSERGIRCDTCHGGDPRALDERTAHSGKFLGKPGKREVVGLCGSCHSDVDRMRPFGLPADEVAEYRTSRHGHLLLDEGNTDVPTCTDCHDAHTILPPDDARSSVYPARIPSTCAKCHADEKLMARYGIPTNQYAEFRESAHGVALLEKGNFAAPSCVGCHGSHSALPPRVTQIANVCGRCHELVRRAFEAGPHQAAADSGKIAGCTACHDNHRTESVPPDRIATTCVECHDKDSAAARTGDEIQQLMTKASLEIRLAGEALDRLSRSGRSVENERFRYETARTAYLQFQQYQHSLDMERLEQTSLRISSISKDIRAAAESSEESRWEHKLLLVPIWFLTLAGLVLAWFRLRDERRRDRGPGEDEGEGEEEDEEEEENEEP